jgi:uncharacterized protein YdeI (YjbR/CyaY-like superfamily)
MNELPILSFASITDWEAWLEIHHADTPGIWLKMARKETGIDSVSYAEALEIALCFGWIDSHKKKFDEQHWLQKFTPRRKGSAWSRVNQEKVANLSAQGRMREAGLREVERAKANGQWETAYESQGRITVPDDFATLLAENPEAKTFFEQLDSANRYAVLYRVTTAKKSQTRTDRMQKLIAMLNNHEKIHN